MAVQTAAPSLLDYFHGSGKGAFIGAVIAILLALVPIALSGLLGKPRFEAQRAVSFTFPGIEEQRYPSGLPFALTDVTVGAVLERAYRRLGLAAQSVSYQDFVDGVTIEPYSAGYELRREGYVKRLSRENLEGPDFELIEGQMRTDLENLHKGNALLRVALEGYSNLSEALLAQMPLTILEEWSRYAIETRGVVRLPQINARPQLVTAAQLGDLTFPLAEEYLVTAAAEINQALDNHQNLPELAVLIDPQSQRSAQDLRQELDALVRFEQTPLLTELESRGLASDWTRARLLLSDEKARIARELDRLERHAETLSGITENYVALDQSLRPARGGFVQASGLIDGERSALNGDYITLGDGFAERIFDIAETAQRHNFVQETLRKKETALQAANDLRARLARITRYEARGQEAGFPSYQEADLARLSALADRYNSLWTSLGNLNALAAAQRSTLAGQLYRLIGEEKTTAVHRPLLQSSNILLLVLAMIGGGFVGLAISLLRQIQRLSRPSEAPASSRQVRIA